MDTRKEPRKAHPPGTALLSLLTLLLLMLLLALASPVHAAVVDSGTCGAEGDGSNLTWVLDDTGTLTISGTGAMVNFTSDSAVPWHDNRNSITSAVVESGITTIGDNAFSNCISLTRITIPDNVTTIAFSAFFECRQLISISVDNNNSVYSSLSGILFNKNATEIIRYPAGLNGGYTIPSSVTTIGCGLLLFYYNIIC